MKILLPQGIGDSIWALHKVESFAKKHNTSIEILLNCQSLSVPAQSRALEFIRRMKCVTSADMYVTPDGTLLKPGPVADYRGFFRYVDDGATNFTGVDFVMIPNSALEKGVRLEDWLPEYDVDWDFAKKNILFSEQERELAESFVRETGPFIAVYMSSMGSNTFSGHNRGPIWTPDMWLELGRRLKTRYGLPLVVFGAEYDRDYYEALIAPRCDWVNVIGRWPSFMDTLAVLLKSRFFVAYQAGIAMVPSYLGLRTLIFWRPHGDSLLPNAYVSCDEKMATAWVKPSVLERGDYIPAFYGRHDIDWIMNEFETRGWGVPDLAAVRGQA